MDELQVLTDKVERLEKLVSRAVPDTAICPLCGGLMRKKAKANALICEQENGHCGEWVLLDLYGSRRSDWPHTIFIRTRMGSGQIVEGMPGGAFKRVYFIAGKQVSKATYNKRAKAS